MKLSTAIGRLRLLAILEGVSYLLFGITMPMKYMMGITEPNFIVGLAHGWLFVCYVLVCFQNIFIHEWSFRTSSLAMIAAFIPFGTFVADAKIFKPELRNRNRDEAIKHKERGTYVDETASADR